MHEQLRGLRQIQTCKLSVTTMPIEFCFLLTGYVQPQWLTAKDLAALLNRNAENL